VQQVGLAKLMNAFGLICVFRGVALMFGSPLAGMIYDATGNYDASFATSGTLLIVSGIIGIALSVYQWNCARLRVVADAKRIRVGRTE
jgi:hypothetical protein